MMYWKLGERIFVEEQRGKDRAEYGEYLITNLSKQLENEFGSGFSYRQLAYCRKFYRIYPIVNAVRSQLKMYVNYFDRVEKLPDENPTVGILLCADKNDTVVKFSLPEDNKSIFTSQYQLYLPSEADLIAEIKEVIKWDDNEIWNDEAIWNDSNGGDRE